jgi:exosortase/archaeosortase family protein
MDPEGHSVTGAPRGRGAHDLRFLVTFVLISGSLCFLYCAPWQPTGHVAGWLHAYLSAYATVVASVLSLLDPTLHAVGTTLSGRFSIQVARDCDAAEALILYGASVLAFPAPWPKRTAGLLAGAAGITALNVTRLCVLYVVGLHSREGFDFAHEASPPLLIIAVLGAFVAWARWVARPRPVT